MACAKIYCFVICISVLELKHNTCSAVYVWRLSLGMRKAVLTSLEETPKSNF